VQLQLMSPGYLRIYDCIVYVRTVYKVEPILIAFLASFVRQEWGLEQQEPKEWMGRMEQLGRLWGQKPERMERQVQGQRVPTWQELTLGQQQQALPTRQQASVQPHIQPSPSLSLQPVL
jgi:hypothetical protein